MIATLLLVLFQAPTSTSLQERLDIARDGAVIDVTGYTRGTVTIRKPVTLVGENYWPPAIDSILLDGPGAGTVALVGLSIIETISGSGFEALKLERMLVTEALSICEVPYLEANRCSFFGPVSAVDSSMLAIGGSSFGGFSAVECRELYNSSDPRLPGFRVSDLLMSDRASAGSTVDVAWNSPGPVSYLYVSLNGTVRPTPMPGANVGHNHLGGWQNGLFLYAVKPVGPHIDQRARITFEVPHGMRGKQIAFQVYDPPGYFSNPAMAIVR